MINRLNLNDIVSANENPEDLFDLLELLGQGSYGEVYKAFHKATGELVAVKIIPTSGEINALKKEIKIMKECESEYIVKYFGSYLKNNHLWLIMEYCTAGSVIDLIKMRRTPLDEHLIASILKQILYGLDYLHENKKIHRDVKAGNILLDEYGNSKLADFGVSTELMDSLAHKDTVIGTPFWMSPEVISKSKYNKKTDIWSLGITAIEMAEGQPPYSHIHPFRAMFAIKSNPPKGFTHPEKMSPEFNAFVQKCLTVDPSKRPNASDLINDPFIQLKDRGRQFLSQFVLKNIQLIEKFRIHQQEKLQHEDTQSFESLQQSKQDSYINETGTMIEHNKSQQLDDKGKLINISDKSVKLISQINSNDFYLQQDKEEEQESVEEIDTGTMIVHEEEQNVKQNYSSVVNEISGQTKNQLNKSGINQNDTGTMVVKIELDESPKQLEFIEYMKLKEQNQTKIQQQPQQNQKKQEKQRQQQNIQTKYIEKQAIVIPQQQKPVLQSKNVSQNIINNKSFDKSPQSKKNQLSSEEQIKKQLKILKFEMENEILKVKSVYESKMAKLLQMLPSMSNTQKIPLPHQISQNTKNSKYEVSPNNTKISSFEEALNQKQNKNQNKEQEKQIAYFSSYLSQNQANQPIKSTNSQQNLPQNSQTQTSVNYYIKQLQLQQQQEYQAQQMMQQQNISGSSSRGQLSTKSNSNDLDEKNMSSRVLLQNSKNTNQIEQQKMYQRAQEGIISNRFQHNKI